MNFKRLNSIDPISQILRGRLPVTEITRNEKKKERRQTPLLPPVAWAWYGFPTCHLTTSILPLHGLWTKCTITFVNGLWTKRITPSVSICCVPILTFPKFNMTFGQFYPF